MNSDNNQEVRYCADDDEEWIYCIILFVMKYV